MMRHDSSPRSPSPTGTRWGTLLTAAVLASGLSACGGGGGGGGSSSSAAASTWSQQAYVKAPNAEGYDFFGNSVAISGDTLVVVAEAEDSNQTTITNGSTASADNSTAKSGAAYVFVRSGNSWSQQAYLKTPNAEADDLFGRSVAISGDSVVVGAFHEDSAQTTIANGSTASADNSASNAGAAYVFKFGN